MRGAITRHVTTPTGQTKVKADYGDDDLNQYRDDVPIADATAQEDRLVTQIQFVMDLGANAVARKPELTPAPEAKKGTIDFFTDLHPTEAIRTYNNLREPDLWDNEQAIWVTNKGMVAVDINRLRSFNGYVRCNGLVAGCSVHVYATIRSFHNDNSTTWDLVKEVCCP